MYLFDTCVVAEARKQSGAHPGVREFLHRVIENRSAVFMSVITVGELRKGVETIRRRGGERQAGRLEQLIHSVQRAMLDHQDVELLEMGVSYMEEQ